MSIEMRRFALNRKEDVSEFSGTGIVASGVQWADGRVAMRWTTAFNPRSTVLYDCIEDVKAIHGHDGKTEVVWMDPEPQRGLR